MNPLAIELNDILKGTTVFELLSDFGKRFFFPKGIVTQSAEAKQKAHRFNATVGMATLGPDPLYMKTMKEWLPSLTAGEIFPYAPTPGVPALRELWKEEIYAKNPAAAGKNISLPLVTTGLTHGISTIADMFFDKGDKIVIPDMFWGNYRLIFEGRCEAEIVSFPFFSEEGGINMAGLESALRAQSPEKTALILNFPNNPTGYSPSVSEVEQITALLVKLAEEGRKLLVISDDAYFGLFFEEDTCTESVFGFLADAHENILAVKVDGATKEELAWGFRVGFITYGGKGLTDEHYTALLKKTGGAVRANISNSSKLGQSLIYNILKDPSHKAQKDESVKLMKVRYLKVREALAKYSPDCILKPLPFNSGYFMTFIVEGKSSEALRLFLLEEYGIGTISIQDKYLRVAYSSVDEDDIAPLYELLEEAAEKL
ncbi:MAG: aminotransferase class I/II-fold pyridoxal phosphate-dependent enzyme [Spirochaetales bacterium]|nr:aminotransferase class I/II-fold pyridoxal phosphate-dependent enzyme [Spirochaetales bacterium]